MSKRSSLRRAGVGLSLLAALAGLVAAFSAGREDPAAVPTSSEVASRVMSPFCPGLSLDECPSQQASELRAKIDERVASGATNREIDRWLVGDYGESVLARPRQALSWMVPAGFLLAGLGAVAYVVAGFSGRPRQAPEAVDPVELKAVDESPYRAQMLEELSLLAKSTE